MSCCNRCCCVKNKHESEQDKKLKIVEQLRKLLLTSKQPNLVFASPNGTSGQPLFRALTDADLPESLKNLLGDNDTYAEAIKQIVDEEIEDSIRDSIDAIIERDIQDIINQSVEVKVDSRLTWIEG